MRVNLPCVCRSLAVTVSPAISDRRALESFGGTVPKAGLIDIDPSSSKLATGDGDLFAQGLLGPLFVEGSKEC